MGRFLRRIDRQFSPVVRGRIGRREADQQRRGLQEEDRYQNEKSPLPINQNEVSDAGFAYTNQICLAGEDCRPVLSVGREVLA